MKGKEAIEFYLPKAWDRFADDEERINIIEKDLSKLEKLEQALKIYQKYIELFDIGVGIMRLKTEFVCSSLEITKEEYELLKELENEILL